MSDNRHAVIQGFDQLGPRHREVLELVARRMTSKEIARQIGVSQHTVEQRIQKIRSRFGNISRRELVEIYLARTNDNEVLRREPDGSGLAPEVPRIRQKADWFGELTGRLPVFAAGFSAGITFAMIANLALIASLR